VRQSLRQAVEHGVLVAVQATGSFRFRHALLAEAVYATSCPASGRSCTHGWPRSSRAAPPPGRRSWRPTGRRRVAAPRPWPPRSRRPARPRRSSA
jgi:hypothetical protein